MINSGEVVCSGPPPQELFEFGKCGEIIITDAVLLQRHGIPREHGLERTQLFTSRGVVPTEIHRWPLLDQREDRKDRGLQRLRPPNLLAFSCEGQREREERPTGFVSRNALWGSPVTVGFGGSKGSRDGTDSRRVWAVAWEKVPNDEEASKLTGMNRTQPYALSPAAGDRQRAKVERSTRVRKKLNRPTVCYWEETVRAWLFPMLAVSCATASPTPSVPPFVGIETEQWLVQESQPVGRDDLLPAFEASARSYVAVQSRSVASPAPTSMANVAAITASARLAKEA